MDEKPETLDDLQGRPWLAAGIALAPAFIVCLLIALLALFLVIDNQSPLSPVESRFVGEWFSPTNKGVIRIFSSDRTFSTSDGQYTGVWHIKDGRLTLTYRQTLELPHDFSFAAVKQSIRRTRQTTLSWDITLAEDGQQHQLSAPAHGPDGQWLSFRVRP
jgi:hypothetical protein